MKILFVVNPVSGDINKENFLQEAKSKCDKYGIKYKLFKTSGTDDEKVLKEIISKFKPDRVASVGGDGTFLFTAINLMDKNIPMGIIPCGSANGMATDLFVNPQPIEAFQDFIMSEVIAGIDMLLINDKHYMIHIGDVGINANIVDAYAKDEKRGLTTYAKYLIQKMSDTKPFKINIKCNGKTYKEYGYMLGICNARKFGTGIPFNLQGNPMDGKFEIIVIQDVNLNSLVKAGLSKFDENFYENQNRIVISTEEAEILFDEPMLLQLDGEVIDEFERIKVNIIPSAVRLITHNNNAYLS